MNILQWLLPWEPSVVVSIAMLAVSSTYFRGCLYVAVPGWQKLLFWTGVFSVYIVCHTQFDYYAEHEFFIHRFQHAILHHLGPFLIIIAQPEAALSAGLPMSIKRYARTITKLTFFHHLIRILMNPVIVTLTFVGLIYFWLIPSVHFIAMLDWRLYRLMNWGMLVNGLMFWGLALRPGPASLSSGGQIAMMLAIIPPQILIGALLFCSSRDLYPLYTVCGRAIGGLSALADQQIGGLILWVYGSMMSVVGILIILRRGLAPLRV